MAASANCRGNSSKLSGMISMASRIPSFRASAS